MFSGLVLFLDNPMFSFKMKTIFIWRKHFARYCFDIKYRQKKQSRIKKRPKVKQKGLVYS